MSAKASVAVPGDSDHDGRAAPMVVVLLVLLVLRLRAALVDDLNPCVVAGAEHRPDGEGPAGVARLAVQDGVGDQLGRQQHQVICERAHSNGLA